MHNLYFFPSISFFNSVMSTSCNSNVQSRTAYFQRTLKSNGFVSSDVYRKSFRYIPSKHSFGFKGTQILNILSNIFFLTSSQKYWIFIDSHKQWNRVPFLFKHFEKSPGILPGTFKYICICSWL